MLLGKLSFIYLVAKLGFSVGQSLHLAQILLNISILFIFSKTLFDCTIEFLFALGHSLGHLSKFVLQDWVS